MHSLGLRLIIGFASIIVVTFLLTASVGLLGFVAYGALRDATSPMAAGLIMGVAGLVTSIVIVLGGKALASGARKQPDSSGPARSAGDIGGFMVQEIGAFIRARPRETLFASLAIGVLLGASPRLRKALLDLLLTGRGTP